MAAPLNQNGSKPRERNVKKEKEIQDADPEYVRYLEELMKDMDDNPALRKELNNADKNDIKKGLIGDKLARFSDQVRSQLDEAKRKSVEQLRVLQKLKNLQGTKLDKKDAEILKLEKEFGIQLPNHFTDNDVDKLMMEKKKILDELDKKRHESFKHHEMQLAHQRKEKLKQMDERARLEAEEKYKKEIEEARKHEKLNHPGSKQQMEEVWEEEDGLEKEQFEPRTFFHLHDTNGDEMLDALELEAMFLVEVRKLYGDNGDSAELHEEMSRMREHVMKEIDRNQDGLLSLNEFLGYTEEDEWKKEDEGWEGIVDENEHYTDEEFKDWEEEYYDYDDEEEEDEKHEEEEGKKHDSEGDQHQRGEEQQTPSPSHHEEDKTESPEKSTEDHHEQPTHDNKEQPKHDEPAQKEIVNSDPPQEQHNQNL